MREKNVNPKTDMGKRHRHRLWIVGIIMLLACLLAACSNSDQLSLYDASSAQDTGNYTANVASEGVSVTSTSSYDAAVASGDESGTLAPGMEPLAADEGGLNRKLIYKADVHMEVKAYADAQATIRDLAHRSGGYILNFEENESKYERSGAFTLKVPSQGFSSLLDDLEQMKPLSIHRMVEGSDVTSEYIDLEARLKAKRVVESRLLSFMEGADSSQDLLAFSNELSTVQEEIERILGRMRYLDQNIAYSTVTIHVYERLDGKSQLLGEGAPFYERAYKAMGKSLRLLRSTLEGLVVGLAAMLPVLIFLALVAVPVGYGYRRYRKTNRNRGGSSSASGSSGNGHTSPPAMADASHSGSRGTNSGDQEAPKLSGDVTHTDDQAASGQTGDVAHSGHQVASGQTPDATRTTDSETHQDESESKD